MPNETVFLSYRRDDAAMIEPLKKALEAAGLKVVDAGAGDFKAAIPNSALFVGCVSAGASAEEEARLAISKLESLVNEVSADLESEVEIENVQSVEVTMTAADVDDLSGGNMRAKIKAGTITADKRAVITGINRRGKA